MKSSILASDVDQKAPNPQIVRQSKRLLFDKDCDNIIKVLGLQAVYYALLTETRIFSYAGKTRECLNYINTIGPGLSQPSSAFAYRESSIVEIWKDT